MKRSFFIVSGLSSGMTPFLTAIASLAGSSNAFNAIEEQSGGRLGVAALDCGSGLRLAYREHERFAMCSTFKFALVAAVLARVDAGRDQLGRFVRYSARDLLEYAPVTRAHVAAGGMTLEKLCAAAIEQSDNTAANLLLEAIGGPAGFTAYARGLGDRTTRLDRVEPALNSAIADDPRDTTTPAAMLALMERILLRGALRSASLKRLESWLAASATGSRRLRAGIPSSWRVSDKTGTGERGATNDIAIVRPPQREPILITAYHVDGSDGHARGERALAAVGRLVAHAFAAR